MKKMRAFAEQLPLYLPRSNSSTVGNKTGTWRYYRPFYDEKTAPCSAACPVGEDIPRIEMLAAQGLLRKAWETIMEENPFPSVCGRVCFHPCEASCNRGQLDEPIAIHCLERFLGDKAIRDEKPHELAPPSVTGFRVAIVGAGPAGLAAGYFLSRLGYECSIYEAQKEPGGILRWGIPVYRLPEDVLRKEIQRIQKQGIALHCDTPVNGKLLAEIAKSHDALFIGCGYGRSIAIKIPGEAYIHDGHRLLHAVRAGKSARFRGKAAVIGGGNTAIDVARTLSRLGAIPVILYRRRKQDMPAFAPEVEMALKEGVELKELVAPIRIEAACDPSSVTESGYQVTLQKMKISAGEVRGRARAIPDGTKTEILTVEHVFRAVGAEPEAFWNMESGERSRQLTLSHCKILFRERPVVYGGDLTNEIKSVTDAIASGKQAAMALDIYFKKGRDHIESALQDHLVESGPALSMSAYLGRGRANRTSHLVSFDEINTDYFLSAPRIVPATLSAHKRSRSFMEIEATLSKNESIKEARRCFNCGICTECDYCRIFCPEVAVTVDKAKRFINLDYCKGCGICVTECPRNAMVMGEEKL
jgi:NADPH-dependent glutamate synthase beta subunit-like oxidoreductase